MIRAARIDTAQRRKFRVRHTTQFQYDRPIEHSIHRLHLRPVHDWKQQVVEHRLLLNPDIAGVEYEDAFGNWTTFYEVSQPYEAMTVTAESIVMLEDVDPFAFASLPTRPTFPVSWMPWDQKMLLPYLTPIELPETQLLEIYDYAKSFVDRNQHDLLETLFDINLTLFREYRYVSGSTNLATTPYDVLVNKQGVCQDFANLFICMARLLELPARYVCGYIHIGTDDQPVQVASHAWVQVYIPRVGWKGFDPTNGCLPSTAHLRVAVGRHYRDTAPVSGTLYTMAHETMQTHVEMVELPASDEPTAVAAPVDEQVAQVDDQVTQS
ncbi:MAG: transglutaminase family protein [Planctomycetaceae bacterium]|nr:transglutaminase family protein [Planctomycetaceae bacterium]